MQFKSPEDFHNKLAFIFHALLALPLAAFIYLFLEIKNNEFQPQLEGGKDANVLIAALFVAGVLDAAFGYYLYKQKKKKAADEATLQEKLAVYFKDSIIFYAFIESASIIMILGLYLTTSSVFIVGYMFILLLLSLNRPTPQKYVGDLKLKKNERDIILHKQPFQD